MTKLKFWGAWKLWRSGGKTMMGESITVAALIMLAFSGIVEGTFSFFAETFWGRVCRRHKKKEK